METILPRYIAYPEFRIIPQAVSVRYGLAVGARCVPLVLGTMYVLGQSSPVFFGLPSSMTLPDQHQLPGLLPSSSIISLARTKPILTKRQNSSLSCNSTDKVKNLYEMTRSPS